MDKSTVICNNILKVIKESENPVSTTDIASKLNKSWHTIDRYCLKLQLAGEIYGFRVGKMNLWIVKND